MLDRIVPDVADAGPAAQIAAGGGFDIQFPGIWQAWMEDQAAFQGIQPAFQILRKVPALEEILGKPDDSPR
jgi:hypothetical protein